MANYMNNFIPGSLSHHVLFDIVMLSAEELRLCNSDNVVCNLDERSVISIAAFTMALSNLRLCHDCRICGREEEFPTLHLCLLLGW